MTLKAFTGLPSKIRIGTVWYKVHIQKDVHVDDTKCVGSCAANEKIIELSTEYLGYNMVEILIHEISHAIFNEYLKPYKGSKHDEETVAHYFGKAWCQIYLDNPMLVTYITNHSNHQRKKGNHY